MEETFKEVAGWVALAVETVGVLVIAGGSLEALVRLIIDLFRGLTAYGWRRKVFVEFGIWLMLGLQFLLGADIVRSAIAPTWDNIGQLAAIAAIRTGLNFFLERDIAKTSEEAKSLAGL